MDHMQASSACRALSSLSSSTTGLCSPVERHRSFQRGRFGSQLVQEEFRWSWVKCGGRESFSCSTRKAIRCRVIGDKPALASNQHWPRRDSNDTREGILLPIDDSFEEERSVSATDGSVHGEPIVVSLREDSSCARRRDDCEGEDSGVLSCSDEAPLPLDSRVESFEGIPGRQWLLTFVESVDPRLRGIIILNILAFLYGTVRVLLRYLYVIVLKFSKLRFRFFLNHLNCCGLSCGFELGH